MVPLLRIGCPVWACAQWRGGLYTRGAERKDYLTQYAQVFDCVEGNSTFYALPSATAVTRWRDETPESFRFCFKFPSDITHRSMLRNVRAETHAFLKLMAPLGVRLGPFMLQLGPRFGGSHLDVLRAYMRELPREFQYVVEVRHSDYFDQGACEASLHEVLRDHDADRCIFDARCMHAGQAVDPSTAQAQSRKPLLPLRTQAVGRRPLVRFIAQNQIEPADAYLDGWVGTLTTWIRAGLEPYFFTHTPDDLLAPHLARHTHERVRRVVPDLPSLLQFPGEREAAARPPIPGQLKLF